MILFLVVPVLKEYQKRLKKFFLPIKTTIFSSDTMNKKSSADILEKIINNEIQILIGTQLISKGFHFPNLNCIVVVDIDLSSQGHDLRGAERIYNYIINFQVEQEEQESQQLFIFKLII